MGSRIWKNNLRYNKLLLRRRRGQQGHSLKLSGKRKYVLNKIIKEVCTQKIFSISSSQQKMPMCLFLTTKYGPSKEHNVGWLVWFLSLMAYQPSRAI